MRRRLFTVLSALSLLPCVATVVLWVGSYRGRNTLRYRGGDTITSNPTSAWSLSCYDGGVLIASWGSHQTDGAGFELNPQGWHTFDAWDNLWLGSTDRWTLLGFRGGSVGSGDEARRFGVVPFWFLKLLLALAPARVARRAVRARARRSAGVCPKCGYLQATPGRCPECGAAPEVPP